jgi:hypothetical protein
METIGVFSNDEVYSGFLLYLTIKKELYAFTNLQNKYLIPKGQWQPKWLFALLGRLLKVPKVVGAFETS